MRFLLATLLALFLSAPAQAVEPKKPREPRKPKQIQRTSEKVEFNPSTTTGGGGSPDVDTGVRVATQAPAPSVAKRLTAAWPGNDRWVLRIARCESRMNPRAVSPTSDVGILQVHWPIWGDLAHSLGYTYSDMKRVEPNVWVAWKIYQRQGPGAWVCH